MDLSKLKVLNLHRFRSAYLQSSKDKTLNKLLRKSPNIEKLDLSKCAYISSEAFKQVVLPALKKMDCLAGTTIPNHILWNILTNMPKQGSINYSKPIINPSEMALIFRMTELLIAFSE